MYLSKNGLPSGTVGDYGGLATLLLAVEQRQGNHVRLGDIARIVDMQMVAAVVVGAQLGRVVWVPQRCVEIDDGVECAATAYPGVDLLTNGFSLRSVEGHMGLAEERVLKRRDRRPDDSNAFSLRTHNELAIAGYDVLGTHLF